MFLTDEKEAALNGILVALQHAADHYAQSVELLENRPADDVFARSLQLRRATALRFSDLLRSLGFLPAQPDPDRLSLTELTTRVKAALTQDIESILAQKALQLEERIRDELDAAEGMAWPEQVVPVLKQLGYETEEVIGQLKSLL